MTMPIIHVRRAGRWCGRPPWRWWCAEATYVRCCYAIECPHSAYFLTWILSMCPLKRSGKEDSKCHAQGYCQGCRGGRSGGGYCPLLKYNWKLVQEDNLLKIISSDFVKYTVGGIRHSENGPSIFFYKKKIMVVYKCKFAYRRKVIKCSLSDFDQNGSIFAKNC